MMEMNEISLVILAGGKSRRMGRDKADITWNGKSFLNIQIEKGRQLGITDILVSNYRGSGCRERIVRDRIPGKGPLSGLEACFREAKYEKCLVLGIDVPLVPVEELMYLREQALKSDAPAVILQHQEHQEPLIGIYQRSLADEMEREILERKGSVFAFLRRVGYQTYHSTADDIYFTNINDPETYQMTKAYFTDRPSAIKI